MRFEVVYEAVYEYEDVVTLNDNVLKVFPREEWWQHPLSDKLSTEPPGKHWFFRDAYGNRAARIRIAVPHRRVLFRVVSLVEHRSAYRVEPGEPLETPLQRSMLPPEARIFLRSSPLVDPSRLEGKAREIAGGYRYLGDILSILNTWVYKSIEYKRGYTTVKTRAHEVLEIGRGVCQDKAHLLIGLLRALGIPARYVSGALTTEPGETHAWVEAYWPRRGWIPLDPTNNKAYDLGHDYVKYAHGRDYTDVPPVNGYFISRRGGSIKKVRVTPKRLD